ncbi:MAG: hydroxypyruvate isomerase family protein [Alphaproteobacteria bacterium]|nr:hydroxypyruvate isomerase family protein [Alphaproteobacteria bacterium]
MPRFAANLSMLFGEVPFLDRFAAAARCGFRGVEFLFPYEWPAEEVARAARDARVEVALFNLPAGDWTRGERGLGALPGREADFAAALEQAIHYAKALACPRVHVMAGLVPADATRAACEATFLANLRMAAPRLAAAGLTGMLEPLNTTDVPGYLHNRTDHALGYVAAVGSPALSLQLDLYHVQIMEGDLARKVEGLAGRYAHVQIAGNPGRNEPDVGEVNFPFVFDTFDRIGYEGWIGCEYRPKTTTEAGLGWAAAYGIAAPR